MRNPEKNNHTPIHSALKKTILTAYKPTSKRMLVMTLGASLLVQPLSIAIPTYAAAASSEEAAAASQTMTTQASVKQLVQLSEEMITSGAKRIDYRWANKLSDGAELSNVHVIEIDLANPYVKLDVMNGKAGTVTGVSSVGNMVNKSGAVAGVNADYFNVSSGKGTPIGAEVTSGNLTASTSELTGMYAFAVTKDRKPIIDTFGFEGNITAADGSSFALAGINKASYRTEPDNGYSHANAMYIYTSAWTVSRPDASDSATTPTEVLVQNDIVKEIVTNGKIQGNPPVDGYILRTHGKAAQFVRDHLLIGQPIKANYNLIANSSGAKVDPSTLQMLVGGHTILVDQGAAAKFSRNPSSISPASDRARTAVGYSKDGSKVMLVTVEDSGSSKGVTLEELQKLLVQLGVWRGINLDGGGSTTMIARPLGETGTQLSFPTEYGVTQRQVANAIGVFTTAPQGQLRGIKASGNTTLFVGQQSSYAMKAYDTFYNPIDPGSLTPFWKSSSAIGTFAGNTFTAAKAGQTTITVQSGSINDKLAVEVIGGDQIAQMSVDASSPVLEQGKTISLPVRVTLKDGRKMTVPAESVKWELRGFTGSVNGNSLTINTVNSASSVGYAIARYDGYSAMAVLAGGADKKFEDFEKVTYPISFSGTNGVLGSASVVTGLPGNESSSSLQLNYDFSAGTGTKAAYAVLNGAGLSVEGTPSAMTMSVMGDSSFNWLRAEFMDKAGKSYLVTLADQVDWSGWKQLKVNLPADQITYPVKLKRIYAASIADGQDERLLIGSLAFDNISFQFPAVVPELPKTKIELKVGSKSASVAGKPYKLDVAPVVLNNTTYLPLRFITEAMGAQINWEGTLKRVSVLRGDKLLEMWLGRKEFLLNGIRKQSEVAPISRGGRSLVPIRLVSEQLGLIVKWDGKMGTITVE
ncbi:stalk domain-containing protein [Paenibacillus solisilvae]|uniref:Stalk domain-containing protein n=1 Tax=Paenibacillus solisilvae TaxID=2486751 RepID=A0ABW0W6I3_9BACL